MLQLRGLLVYPFADGKYVTIGGNMRLQALKRLNYTECPWIVIPKETPVGKLRNYIVKDNGDFGDWDYKTLLAEWDAAKLESWAIDVQPFEDEETRKETRRMELRQIPKKAFATWLTTSHGIRSAHPLLYHVSRRVKKVIRFRHQVGFRQCGKVRASCNECDPSRCWLEEQRRMGNRDNTETPAQGTQLRRICWHRTFRNRESHFIKKPSPPRTANASTQFSPCTPTSMNKTSLSSMTS